MLCCFLHQSATAVASHSLHQSHSLPLSLSCTHTQNHTLYIPAQCVASSQVPSLPAGKHIQYINKNKLLKQTLCFRFITHSRGGLTHHHTDTHTLKQNALSPASLFVADGGGPTAPGTALRKALLGGKNQIQ